MTVCAYKFNLSRQLTPVAEEEYVTSKYSVPQPVRIEAPGGKLLAHVQFVPWQDGGYLRLVGKLPLIGLLVFLGRRDASVIRREYGELTNVLPITSQDFKTLLGRIQRQSNLTVVPEKAPSWTISQVANEGTSSPFVARLFAGILGLRDQVISAGPQKDKFDRTYEAILTSLQTARNSSKQIVATVRRHREKVDSGQIAALRHNTTQISENIDELLRKEIEAFLNSSVRAVKGALQQLLKDLGVDIGFLYKKQSAFEAGVRELRASDPDLATYLAQSRADWSERLINTRNALHGSWALPRVRYSRVGTHVTMSQPEIDGQPLSEFVLTMFDRACCFVEEMTAHALQSKLPAYISLMEIPVGQRPQGFPQRFRIALTTGGTPIWHIAFHGRSFDNA